MKIDYDAIKKLANLLEDTGLTEIEVADGDQAVRVCKGGTVVAGAAAPVAMASDPAIPQVANTGAIEAPAANSAGAVTSPMVGTAYLKPDPNSAPFVQKGDAVKAGDTLLIIEAMKVMNPIKAEKAGTVTQILVGDAQPVEFGDVLVVVE
ncbi:MAG: acetyl-CoA carboxylase, biotin carboxyl carrier protein [Alphaproteobacteria bacterium]|nr:acetyl-CoA carboxylase, biotin carboxyl carrier protein [Alphaproteobacteria bacterium]|tara:strand:- start:36702 stop:37151 length:450 start_codon:yes stop_codon:yes gene_type:complete